jgi:hypothetical protein
MTWSKRRGVVSTLDFEVASHQTSRAARGLTTSRLPPQVVLLVVVVVVVVVVLVVVGACRGKKAAPALPTGGIKSSRRHDMTSPEAQRGTTQQYPN